MNRLKTISALLLTSACFAAVGAQSDFNQKVAVNADRQLVDIKKNSVTYIGNVTVQQGTLRISAEQLQVFNARTDGKQVFVATGSPSHYQQTLDSGKVMKAEAETVRYELTTSILLLEGKAKLMQEGSQIKADSIRYNLDKQTLEADSNKSGTERVTTIFTPEKSEQSSPKNSEPAN